MRGDGVGYAFDELALEGRLDEGLALDRVDGEEGRDEADEDAGSGDKPSEGEEIDWYCSCMGFVFIPAYHRTPH